ncbi:MAG: BON domain-containing protein, partial [Pseudomonadota bacterium]
MNLFKFVKNAGEKIAGSVGNAAGNIKERVTGHKIDVKDLDVETQGEKVVLKGTAKTQEEAEKAILAAGNNAGVAE